MPKKFYAELEQHIIATMQRDRLFKYQRRMYEVLEVGKPRPNGRGECKTDVYAAIRDTESNTIDELKISVKTEGSHEFEGNKITAETAEAYFGKDWQEIVYEATTSLCNEFENRVLIYASGMNRIQPNSITVGWKLEFARKPRTLSVRIPLTDKQVRDFVYKGTNQSQEKIDAVVNGHVVRGSGVADYLLVTNKGRISSINDVLNQMVLIDEADIEDTYMIFTANNYRSDVDKADGSRALAVRVEWRVINGKLEPIYCYDHPLMYTGEKDMAKYVKYALSLLGKRNISDINPYKDLSDPKLYQE